MRKLLIILLFLISAAQLISVLPILGSDKAPLLAQLAPFILIIGAVASAIMLMKFPPKAFIPYCLAFATFLIMEISVFGITFLKGAFIGFLIAGLFFIPSVRTIKK
jgi:hypothetical protein